METELGGWEGEYPQLLALISNEKNWLKRDTGGGKSLCVFEERKLELRLAPPNGEGWPEVEEEEEEEELDTPSSLLSSNSFSKFSKSVDKATFIGAKRGFLDTSHLKYEGFLQQSASPLEANGMMEQRHERRGHAFSDNGALVKKSPQIKATSAPVVGWPPIRSFRKNIAFTTTKQSDDELRHRSQKGGLKGETSKKGLFVKINMDGIPIGRKVDINAFDSYQKLSFAVEELFSGLLAAQRDLTASCTGICENQRMAFIGLLDGSGEYTLVYEDNEGDRMMVGDIPWDMFVSTAKRLRVLKNSELSATFLSSEKEQHNAQVNKR